MDLYVTESVKRLETLAREDCDLVLMEDKLFRIVDEVRQGAGGRQDLLDEIADRLEGLAHRVETPPPMASDDEDQGAPLRHAGCLRRAADLLRGPEKDLTPRGVSDEGATPRR
jgi:hypothetical protein